MVFHYENCSGGGGDVHARTLQVNDAQASERRVINVATRARRRRHRLSAPWPRIADRCSTLMVAVVVVVVVVVVAAAAAAAARRRSYAYLLAHLLPAAVADRCASGRRRAQKFVKNTRSRDQKILFAGFQSGDNYAQSASEKTAATKMTSADGRRATMRPSLACRKRAPSQNALLMERPGSLRVVVVAAAASKFICCAAANYGKNARRPISTGASKHSTLSGDGFQVALARVRVSGGGGDARRIHKR